MIFVGIFMMRSTTVKGAECAEFLRMRFDEEDARAERLLVCGDDGVQLGISMYAMARLIQALHYSTGCQGRWAGA